MMKCLIIFDDFVMSSTHTHTRTLCNIHGNTIETTEVYALEISLSRLSFAFANHSGISKSYFKSFEWFNNGSSSVCEITFDCLVPFDILNEIVCNA